MTFEVGLCDHYLDEAIWLKWRVRDKVTKVKYRRDPYSLPRRTRACSLRQYQPSRVNFTRHMQVHKPPGGRDDRLRVAEGALRKRKILAVVTSGQQIPGISRKVLESSARSRLSLRSSRFSGVVRMAASDKALPRE